MVEGSRQAGAKIQSDRPTEPFVTFAMERAGLEALWSFDQQDDDPREIVREVYQAMALAIGSIAGWQLMHGNQYAIRWNTAGYAQSHHSEALAAECGPDRRIGDALGSTPV